jgi:hypothetical protein
VLVIWALASGTTAPAGSVTVPKTSAEFAVCAQDGTADSKTTIKTNPIANLAENFIRPPPTESAVEQDRFRAATSSGGANQERNTSVEKFLASYLKFLATVTPVD